MPRLAAEWRIPMENTEKSKRSIHPWLYAILGALLVAVLIWGINTQKNAQALETNVENSYNRAFSDLVGYIDNIDVKLTKAQLAHTPAQLASISNDIFSEAAEAKSCLGQLPTAQIQLDNTSKFLSQVGDYTYVLSQSMIKGEEISQEQYKTLSDLNDFAASLKENLVKIQNEIYAGNIKLSQMNQKQKRNVASADENGILESMENVEKAFDEYPALIYDGPFSEHIENRSPVMLENAAEISEEDALKRAQEFLGDKGRGLKKESETENTQIPAYNFTAANGSEQISISITKKGGHVLYFLDNISVENANLDVANATEKALAFLESRGIYDMTSSYYEKTNNVATINFAYSQNGVICYSDLIKVRVALDNGSIVGFESKGYLMNHSQRQLNTPQLDENEAKSRIAPNLQVTCNGLALIPKDSLKEVLCYEFKGTFKDKNFIIYINADNGREENILLLLESDEGILTI